MYNFSKILCEKKFSNKVSKQAYLEACKWLAQNVYSKVELSKFITVQIIKEKTAKKQLPTFTVKLFMAINEDEVKESYCNKCKQLHTIFYSIEKPDCKTCKMHGYIRQLEMNVDGLVNNWENHFVDEDEWDEKD